MSVTAVNPILSGFYPDPSACAVGDDYYIVNSSFCYFPGLPIMHSKDLAHWEQIGNAMDRNSQLPLAKDEVSRGLFAPTIRYNNGMFYIICTNVTFGGNFVITAKDPKGPWSEPHYIEGAEGIDPSLFFDDDGKCYYTGTHPNPDGCKYDGDWYIYTQELDIENFKLVGECHNVWNGAMKGVHWPEGPHLYKIGDYYYIMHAEGGTGPNHAISVARSKNVFGPFENNFNNPIFTHRHLGIDYPIKYVGHGDLFKAANGEWYMTMLAVRPIDKMTTMGRETFLAKVVFEEGWPVVNPGIGILTDEVEIDLPEYKPESNKDMTPLSEKYYEFDKMKELPFSFLTIHNPSDDLWNLTDMGLNIKCQKEEPGYLCLRQDAHAFEATCELRTDKLNDGAKAGLCLFQNAKYNLRIEYEGGKGAVIMTKDGTEEILTSMVIKEDKVSLFISVKGLTASLFIGNGSKVEPLAKNLDISSLSTEVAGGFVGCTIGMYASADEKLDTDVYACFKSFSYRPTI